MLVPHFSQVWIFLTPPTDVLSVEALGESFPGNRKAASGVKHRNKAAHWDVVTGLLLCLSHNHSGLPPLSVELVFCFPLIITKLIITHGTRFHETGFHTSVIITSWKNVIALWIYLHHHLSKRRGGKEDDRFITWYAVHNMNCTRESVSSCTGDGHMAVQVTTQWRTLACSVHNALSTAMILKWRGDSKTTVGGDINYVAFDRIAESWDATVNPLQPVQRGYCEQPSVKIQKNYAICQAPPCKHIHVPCIFYIFSESGDTLNFFFPRHLCKMPDKNNRYKNICATMNTSEYLI